MGSPLAGNINNNNTIYNNAQQPCPSPSYSVASFDSRACFPPQPYQHQHQLQQPHFGPPPPAFFQSPQMHQYHHQQQQQQQQFNSPQQFHSPQFPPMFANQQQQHRSPPMQQNQSQHQLPPPPPGQEQPAPVAFAQDPQQSRRAFSSEELLEVASNLLGIGLGHASSFSRSGVSSPSSFGGATGAGGNEYDRQAVQLERILFLSSVAATLRSASDNITTTASTSAKDALTPRSVSSPSPSVILGGSPATAGPPALPIDAAIKATTPLLRETTPLPDVVDVAAVVPVSVTTSNIVSDATEPARVRTETYQVRGNGFRTRANTLTVAGVPLTPPGLPAPATPTGSFVVTAHNHSAHEETNVFLRAGTAPGFLNNGARLPGPRAGLAKRTMAVRAIDAMRNATRREGKEGGKLVAREREEVFEREEVEAELEAGEPEPVVVKVGDLAPESKREER